MLWGGKPVDDRQSISRKDLQSAITEAVKQSGPDYEAFVDVIVEREEPESKSNANWAIKGIKFGKCDREKAAQIIAVIVARMQREFKLKDPAASRVSNSVRRVSTQLPLNAYPSRSPT